MHLRRLGLTSLSLASLMAASWFAALPARAQTDAIARASVCRGSINARREAQLLAAIDQAQRERSGNTVSLSEALSSFEGILPPDAQGAGPGLANLLGTLEMALGMLGGGSALQNLDFGQLVAIAGPLSDRLGPLLSGGMQGDDPLAMMQVMMEAMSEIRQVNEERARVAPNRVESLSRELAALRQECRAARPGRPAAPAPETQPLPAPEPTAVAQNVFTETCDRQDGSAIAYYEGQPPTDATNGDLVYEQVLECLPSATGLEAAPLEAACTELGGEIDRARPNPTCRLAAEVPDF